MCPLGEACTGNDGACHTHTHTHMEGVHTTVLTQRTSTFRVCVKWTRYRMCVGWLGVGDGVCFGEGYYGLLG